MYAFTTAYCVFQLPSEDADTPVSKAPVTVESPVSCESVSKYFQKSGLPEKTETAQMVCNNSDNKIIKNVIKESYLVMLVVDQSLYKYIQYTYPWKC